MSVEVFIDSVVPGLYEEYMCQLDPSDLRVIDSSLMFKNIKPTPSIFSMPGGNYLYWPSCSIFLN